MRLLQRYTDLANCVAWFDTLGGVTLNGSELTSWTDQSGAGLTQPATVANAIAGGLAAAVGPVYLASDPTFAGKPTLAWGVGETCLDTPLFAADLALPLTFLICGISTTAIVATARNMVTGPDALPAARTCAISNRAAALIGIADDSLLMQFGPTDFTKNNLAAAITAPFVACFSCTAVGTSCIMRASAWNRQDRGTTIVQTPRTHGGWRFGRGRSNASAGLNWIGKINAFVAWNRFLADGEQRMAIALMARRQGVTLPARIAKTRTAVPAPGAVGGRTWIL